MIFLIHCTFRYHPKEKEIFNEIVGNYYCLLIIGYACDGQNSGFLIDLPTELQKYYINYEDDTKTKLRIPHITCSYSKNAIPNKTKDLNFLPIKLVKIKDRFGYWIKEENNEYLSFEPFYEKNK